MEKTCCEMKCTETEDGFRIEVKGKDAKKWFSCCAPPRKE